MKRGVVDIESLQILIKTKTDLITSAENTLSIRDYRNQFREVHNKCGTIVTMAVGKTCVNQWEFVSQY